MERQRNPVLAFLACLACLCLSGAAAACSNSSTSGTPSVPTHPQGSVVAVDSVGQRPFGVAISGSGTVYFTRLDDSTTIYGSIANFTFPDSIRVGDVPTDVAFTLDGATAFVSNQMDNTVGVVNVAAHTQTSTLSVSNSAYRVRVNGAGTKLYATTAGTLMHIFNAATLAPIKTVTLPAQANGLTFDSTGNFLYVSSQSAGSITKLDANADTVLQTFPVGPRPEDIAISLDGTEMWVADETLGVQIYALPSFTLTTTLSGTVGAWGLAMTPDGTQVYVTLPSAGGAIFYDRATMAVVRSYLAGVPRRIAFDHFGDHAAIADELYGAVLIQ
jgi:DNA-binding beta-propeller fold protein YncE